MGVARRYSKYVVKFIIVLGLCYLQMVLLRSLYSYISTTLQMRCKIEYNVSKAVKNHIWI
jgi:hypothetical protein